ncbi:MAG: D-alanyl-D-alanine carboxypeptidase [Clostridia bacterium]|nr:D-alanyl-D-alanine carboxypeptidase [Clostridia bacterium]
MKKILSVFLCLFAVFSLFPRAHALEISALSAVLIEAESGDIIYEKDAHTRRGMASTTKIMTALCAIESMDTGALVTVPPEAVGVEGSSVYLKAGEKMTLEDLLYAMMLQSANDAAEAIAIAVSGSVEAFAELMNAKAAELGLCDTHFENPHGLDGAEHYTTAYELAKIAAHALKNETFARIVSTVKHTIPASEGTQARTLVNHNRMLRQYEDIIGVKTGFTKKCGRTLVSAARRDGVTLVCVTLNDGNDWQDHRAMLDYGFGLYENVRLCEAGELCFTLPVAGSEVQSTACANKDGLCAVLRKTHGEITTKTELPRFIYAGQKREAPVGKVRFFCGGRELGSVPLYLKEEVPKKEGKKGFFGK